MSNFERATRVAYNYSNAFYTKSELHSPTGYVIDSLQSALSSAICNGGNGLSLSAQDGSLQMLELFLRGNHVKL